MNLLFSPRLLEVTTTNQLSQGWRTYGARPQNGMREDFLGTRHSPLSQLCLFIFPDQRLYIVRNMCVYICIYEYIYISIYIYLCIYIHIYIHTHIRLRRDCIWITVATKWYCSWDIFTHIGSGAKCWLDIDHWDAGLAVTWRIRDNA